MAQAHPFALFALSSQKTSRKRRNNPSTLRPPPEGSSTSCSCNHMLQRAAQQPARARLQRVPTPSINTFHTSPEGNNRGRRCSLYSDQLRGPCRACQGSSVGEKRATSTRPPMELQDRAWDGWMHHVPRCDARHCGWKPTNCTAICGTHHSDRSTMKKYAVVIAAASSTSSTDSIFVTEASSAEAYDFMHTASQPTSSRSGLCSDTSSGGREEGETERCPRR